MSTIAQLIYLCLYPNVPKEKFSEMNKTVETQRYGQKCSRETCSLCVSAQNIDVSRKKSHEHTF